MVPLTTAFVHCPRCGEARGGWTRNEFRCPECGFRFFQNVAAACGVLLEHEGRVLFLERAQEPARGKWGLPGGFIDGGESAEAALRREVREEIGGEIADLAFLASFPNRYAFEGVTYDTCDLYFRARLVTDPLALRPDRDEVSQLVWTSPDLDPERLAFSSLRALWSSLRDAAGSR